MWKIRCVRLTAAKIFSVERWIEEFEDNAELMEWNDLHKYIFAKKSLRGLAKLYIQGEAGLNSWRSLKRTLLKEFSTKINSVKLHETLRTRQIKKVYYVSKKTTPAERKYCSYELEVLAIVEALKKFRIYLLGHNFKIITDCNAFQKTMHKKELTTRVARWALLLEEFNYQIEHRSGSRMRHVDALSRYPIMQITEALIPRIRKAQDKDDQIKTIKEILCYKEYDDYFMRTAKQLRKYYATKSTMIIL
ncbi:RNase H-like domain found in reverse transcriptase [Popillia japonica]|uniref:RNase H-like domain found in reverse transcriptase n=1 Tax=Popillia japonica TaxID=7064 RepID=A0AAW1L4J5_POPJA